MTKRICSVARVLRVYKLNHNCDSHRARFGLAGACTVVATGNARLYGC